MELHHWSSVAAIVMLALESGGRRVSPTTVEWDVSNGCSSPVMMSYTGRPEAEEGERYVIVSPGDKHTLTLEMWVACRKCERCMRRRRRMWTMRAAAEISQAKRTWFVTLTLEPSRRYQCEAIAEKRDIKYRSREQDEQDKARFAVIAEEIQRFLKRIRKNSGAKLRYICVQELHKSGEPHYHLLIHEVEGTLTKAVLQAGWRWGFSQAKLTDPRTAIYVCKYLSKSEGARVRASLGYGRARTVYSQSEGSA
nr:MAG: replication initiator protein [Microvirus sp.]